MMTTSTKVLVTGGAGYIGAHTVVELAAAGYEPVIIDDLSKSDDTLLRGIQKIIGRAPLFLKGNCLDRHFLRKVFTAHEIKCVLHFAAYKSVTESVEAPLSYYENNLQSLVCLLDVMQEFNVRDLIFSSSCTVYGQPDIIPVTEEAPFKKAESPYGATKQMCERILEDISRKLRIVSLRYFNPIGAHPSGLMGELPIGPPNNLVPYITQVAIGKREKLTVFGNDYDTPDGSCIRDFIHVVDLAGAHLKAMEYLKTQSSEGLYNVFNVGTGRGVSVLELIKTFEEVTGVKLNFVIGPRRSGDVEKTYADPAKVNRVMGWNATLSMKQALADAWNWEQKLASNK